VNIRKKLPLLALAGILLLGLTAAEATTWRVDKSHSSVGFTVRHMMVSKVSGTFQKYRADVTFDPDAPASLRVHAVIDAASIDTGNRKRDEHLRSADFFDVTRFPEITFTTTAVKPEGDHYLLTGDLAMHGVTRPVTLTLEYNGTVTDPWGNVRAGFSAAGEIDRRDWGIVWNKALDRGGLTVSNTVKLAIEVELVAKGD